MTCSKSINFVAGPGDEARRIDRVTRKMFPALPLSAVFRALRKGQIRINGTRARYNTILHKGDTITVPESFPQVRQHANKTSTREQFASVYEDDSMLVLNKKAGEPLFGTDGLIHRIRSSLEPTLEASLSFRPSFVHRIDRPSSGLLICAKTLQASQTFSSLFRKHNIYKEYITIVEGVIKTEELWEDRINRDTIQKKSYQSDNDTAPLAQTRIIPAGNNGRQTLLRVIIYTGRTHQIRVQTSSRGYPVYGDLKYGQKAAYPMLLHAYKIVLPKHLAEFPSKLIAPLTQQQRRLIKSLFPNSTIDQSTPEDVEWQ